MLTPGCTLPVYFVSYFEALTRKAELLACLLNDMQHAWAGSGEAPYAAKSAGGMAAVVPGRYGICAGTVRLRCTWHSHGPLISYGSDGEALMLTLPKQPSDPYGAVLLHLYRHNYRQRT